MTPPDTHLMLAFEGTRVPDWLRDTLATRPPAGVTLFREHNIESPSQVTTLIEELQELNSGDRPLLIAIDQEGGQLLGLTGSTPFAGNMALGAAGDPELTRRVAEAMGRELRAVGINLNYAPVADVASRPRNPSLGVRAFGEDPRSVARHVAAAVTGFRSAGVLTTLKHFPGKGEATVDPHYELPRMDLDRDRLDRVELAPFVSGFAAGADVLMTGHYSVPALTNHDDLPVSMSEGAIDGFVRGELGFDGLVITDALDMGALDQGAGQIVDIIASIAGGTDLLLCMPDPDLRERARLAVERGVSRRLISRQTLDASDTRIDKVRAGIQLTPPDPAMVGSHDDLARELARRSVTLVRNDDGVLPLSGQNLRSILVLEPKPTNVTPADTSALYPAGLGRAVTDRHEHVTSITFPHSPEPAEVASLVQTAEGHDLVIVGTVNTTDGQSSLVSRLVEGSIPVVTVAMREPQDLGTYPGAPTHVCTYSGHLPSMEAAAAAMFGEARFEGRLPVSIPGIHELGHGL